MTVIIGIRGEHQGKTFSLSDVESFKLGRSEARCDLHFRSNAVSRMHATILRRGAHYYLVDAGSHNGTRLNQNRIESETPYRLDHGAQIELCGNVLEVRSHPSSLQSLPEDYSSTVAISLTQQAGAPEGQSAAVLAWLLKLIAELSQERDTTTLLSLVLDELFNLFQQADRALLFLPQESFTWPIHEQAYRMTRLVTAAL